MKNFEKNEENQRRKPKQVRALEKYHAVLDACSQLLLERGYHKTSMLELSLSSGVAIPTIYQYFPNKEGVFRAWFERLGVGVFETLIQLDTSNTQYDLVELYISHALSLLSFQRQSAKVLLDELPGTLTTELIQSIEQQTLQFVNQLFGELLSAQVGQDRFMVLIRLLLGYTIQLMMNSERKLDIDFETRELAKIVRWFFILE